MSAKPHQNRIRQVIDFVVKDVTRLVALDAATPGASIKENGFPFHLTKPDEDETRNWYPISHESNRKLRELAEEIIIADEAMRERVRVSDYQDAFEAEIVRLWNSKNNSDARIVQDIVGAAREATMATLETKRTYIFPVHSAYDRVEPYTIGPATFMPVKVYFDRNSDAWAQTKKEHLKAYTDAFERAGKPFDLKNWDDLLGGTEEYFRRYRWLATVEINGVQKDVGELRAKEVLEDCFSLLRLFHAREDNAFIGFASESPTQTKEWKFSVDAKGCIQPYGWSRLVDIPRAEGFIDRLRSSPGWGVLENAIAEGAAWKPLRPAHARLIAALRWFGEGWKEVNPTARIVKYSICLEGLLSTGEKEALTETLAERVALLCFEDLETRKKAYQEMREIYKARSNVVHGASNADINPHNIARRAENMARHAVLGFAKVADGFATEDAKFGSDLKEFFLLSKLAGGASRKRASRKGQV